MVSHFVVPSLTMKIFHVFPKKYSLKIGMVSKTVKKLLNKSKDIFYF